MANEYVSLKSVLHIVDLVMSDKTIKHTGKAIRKRLKELPTADVVEVVRCKKCEHSHWEQEPCHGKTEYYCPKLKSKVDTHFYCALGKRKEGAEE